MNFARSSSTTNARVFAHALMKAAEGHLAFADLPGHEKVNFEDAAYEWSERLFGERALDTPPKRV